ncbi:MAG TPA: glucose-6-phosphate isomerase [Deltaproteobacteria bacterium]|nr:glucose-6-phosphate isomerase [Deltaproteobacteria bacterium]
MPPHRDIHLDCNEAFAPQQAAGLTEIELEAAVPAFVQVHRALQAMHEMGQVQFMHLPFLEEVLRSVERRAEELRQSFDTMVVLGIGGSALGAKAIEEAVLGPRFQKLPSTDPKRIFVLDTLDPLYISRLLESLELERCVFNVVSKSGNTVETMAQFMYCYDLLKQRLGAERFRRHLVMTTDAAQGALRQIADQEGIESFEILPGVGGRFSVLSPVGLLPAAFLGISIQELAEGAVHLIKRCAREDLWTNPAAMLAMLSYLLAEKHDKRNLVVFNYSESCNSVVEWFRQLWAESLGKRQSLSGQEIFAGITPIRAGGPRDQHSQMQLYVEGPRDKMVMFWSQERYESDLKVPQLYSEIESLNYLGGKKFSEILAAELVSTEHALREAGVPNFRLIFYDTGPYTLGQLFYLLEIATVYVGGLLNVNPYNQPGVELGKKYLYGKLGRFGAEEFGATLARKLKEKRYVV